MSLSYIIYKTILQLFFFWWKCLTILCAGVLLFCISKGEKNWVKVFMNGPSKICGRQPLKNLQWYGLQADHITANFWKAVFHKFYLVLFLNTLTHLSLLFPIIVPPEYSVHSRKHISSNTRITFWEMFQFSCSKFKTFLFNMTSCVPLIHWDSGMGRLLIESCTCKSWSVRTLSVAS